MSTPMYDVPDHFPIGVNAQGEGPLNFTDEAFVCVLCWCGNDQCRNKDFLSNKAMVESWYNSLRTDEQIEKYLRRRREDHDKN